MLARVHLERGEASVRFYSSRCEYTECESKPRGTSVSLTKIIFISLKRKMLMLIKAAVARFWKEEKQTHFFGSLIQIVFFGSPGRDTRNGRHMDLNTPKFQQPVVESGSNVCEYFSICCRDKLATWRWRNIWHLNTPVSALWLLARRNRLRQTGRASPLICQELFFFISWVHIHVKTWTIKCDSTFQFSLTQKTKHTKGCWWMCDGASISAFWY